MLCQNCGQNEANIKYTQIINGVKEQMNLCNECAKELGIEDINFNMPISFSSFLGDVFDMYEDKVPTLIKPKELICNKCNMTYDQFLKTGKFGCDSCYETFKTKLDVLLKNVHGANRHIGRLGKSMDENLKNKKIRVEENIEEINNNLNVEEQNKDKEVDEQNIKLEKLKERLKQEIREERYEDAAKTRDEIKNCQKGRGILTILCQKRASLMTQKGGRYELVFR